VSEDWNSDDLARLIALENMFGALSFMWSAQFASTNEMTSVEAVNLFRDAVLSSSYDMGDRDPAARKLIVEHIQRNFDHILSMARLADDQAG